MYVSESRAYEPQHLAESRSGLVTQRLTCYQMYLKQILPEAFPNLLLHRLTEWVCVGFVPEFQGNVQTINRLLALQLSR